MKNPVHFHLILGLVLLLGLTACQSPPTGGSGRSSEGVSLFERRLLRVYEMEMELKARALETEEGAPVGDLQRRFEQIVREYESIVADNPEEVEALLLFGKFLAWFGDREGAHTQFLRAQQIAPRTAVVQQQLGAYYAEEGDFHRALAFYLRAVELAPNEAAYHTDLGELLYVFSPGFIADELFTPELIDEMMLEAFTRAAELSGDDLIPQFRLGQAFYDVDSPPWPRALAHWEQLYKRNLSATQRDAVRLHRARALLALERYDEAEQVALEVRADLLIETRDALIADIRAAR
jgi:tetratricopeptide (TPR) repeat protein